MAFRTYLSETQIGPSIFWIAISAYLLFYIKTYIFPGCCCWPSRSGFCRNKPADPGPDAPAGFRLHHVYGRVAAGYFMVQYFTSQETVRQYQLDNLVSAAENQRLNYLMVDLQSEQRTSYYSINASNPFLLVVNSIGAPFPAPALRCGRLRPFCRP